MKNEKINEIAAAIAAAIGSEGVTAEKCAEIARGEIEKIIPTIAGMIQESAGVRRVEVVTADAPAVDCGVQHKNFEKLLRLVSVRDAEGFAAPVYLYGPAGTGKTTAAKNLARALGLPFYFNGAITSPFELTGFVDAGGKYQETPFYRAYTGGGVYLFDELDASSPAAVLAFNAALANGHAAFPTGNAERNRDCIIIAGGNTSMRGDGALGGFQRAKFDAAFRDRFVFLEWPIDEALENALAAAYGDIGREWAADVQTMRQAAARVGVRDFEITPRATLRGAAMLAAGIDRADVLEAVVRKGLNAETWDKIKLS